MFNTTHLEPNQVPAMLRGAYNGKKFQARVVTEMTIPIDAGLWSGGSRDLYSAIKADTGERVAMPGQHLAPWSPGRNEYRFQMVSGIIVVLHSMFCGKDMGLTFYVHPDNAAKLLPAPEAPLNDMQRLVLNATASLKSSYNGRDRYEMTCDNMRYDRGTVIPTRAQWDTAKAELIASGHLDKRGAITVKGRNANK